MKKLLLFVENKLVRPMGKLSEQRHLVAVRNGLLAVFPLSLIGSLFYLVTNLPLPESWAIQKFIVANANTIMIPYRMTVVLVTLYVVVGVGVNLAKSYRYDAVSGGLVALAAFLMTTVPSQPSAMVPEAVIQNAAAQGIDAAWLQNLQDLGWVMPQTPMSGIGVYVGVFSAIAGVEMIRFSKWLSRKVHKTSVWKKTNIPKSVVRTLDTLRPILFVVVTMFIVRDVIGFDFQKVILSLFDLLIRSSTTFSGAIIYALVLSVFSFFGMLGYTVSGSAASVAWARLIVANQLAHAAGITPPNVAALPFFHYFVWIGGTGGMLCLVGLMCFSKSGYLRKLGKSCLLPSLANISQPVLYGAPVLLNPYMFIPFVLVPQVTTMVTYLFMQFNFVARPYANPSSSYPFFVGAYLSTGDWKAILLAVFNFLIGVVIYFPFFKAYEKKLIAEGEKQAKQHALNSDNKLKITPVE